MCKEKPDHEWGCWLRLKRYGAASDAQTLMLDASWPTEVDARIDVSAHLNKAVD